jgi:hypothetical protein
LLIAFILFIGIFAAFLPILLYNTPPAGKNILKLLTYFPDAPAYMKTTGFRVCQYIMAASDFITAICYFVIPFFMYYIYRVRKDIPFSGIFLLFVAFIVCCGSTHFITIFGRWFPLSTVWVVTAAKFITAAVSLLTAIVLVRSVSLVLSVPSTLQLEQEVKVFRNFQYILII